MKQLRKKIFFIIAALLCTVTILIIVAVSSMGVEKANIQVSNKLVSPFTMREYLVNKVNNIPKLEDGDILVSFSTITMGWRHGHIGLVVDADRGLVLEATSVGEISEIDDVERWSRYSSLSVLRLKGVSNKERGWIAQYATEKLVGIPYKLTSGIWGERLNDKALTANCAFLVWYAYAVFGYNLDSDRGRIITVRDIYESKLLQKVVIFGID